ncbi:flagellar hook-length control protein FliK [Humidesulfovibrio idahonensis]
MQEVTSTTSDLGNSFDQMRTSALVDLSSQSRAFADFMRLGSQSSQSSSSATSTATNAAASAVNPAATVSAAAPIVNPVNNVIQTAPLSTSTSAASTGASTSTTNNAAAPALPTVGSGVQNLFAQINGAANTAPAQPLVQSDTASTLATTVSTAASTTRVASKSASKSTNSTKNTPVSRTAFEKSKALLAKAGLSDSEIEDLSGRVQAGTLTWGQLAQTLGAHTAGAKKNVELSASETADLQSMFQKMGFAGTDASAMVKSVASGDGLKVLSAIQNKLSATTDDSTLGFNTSELATFFKALRVPDDTAAKLSQKLAGDTATAADMKNALATISQAMQEQRTKASATDTEVAKGLAKIMEKDVAKSARDTTSTTTAATSSSSGQVPYDLKTKDRNDTSWFNDHEKTQQKTSDDAWSKFNGKVRADESGPQQNGTNAGNGSNAGTGTGTSAGSTVTGHTLAQNTGKESLDAAINRSAQALATAQTATGTTQTAKGFEQVTAPKVLDQVTQAMLKDLGQGRKQLTVELDPENLGKVQVMLQVKGKEVTAVISAEDSGTAAMLQSNMEGLRKSLEDKGLTVQSMEVQTGLASRQDQQTAFNAEQHNQQAQEQQEMSRIFSQMRMMRADSGEVALDMQNTDMQAILADQGLHLIA